MPTTSKPKGIKLSKLKVGKDHLLISFSFNTTAAQAVRGTFMGQLQVGEDACIVVRVVEGKPYEAVPLEWVKSVERTRPPELVNFTAE